MVKNSPQLQTNLSGLCFCLAMLGSLLLMFPVSWVYQAIHLDGDHDHSLDETTLVLPAVVAGIVMVV